MSGIRDKAKLLIPFRALSERSEVLSQRLDSKNMRERWKGALEATGHILYSASVLGVGFVGGVVGLAVVGFEAAAYGSVVYNTGTINSSVHREFRREQAVVVARQRAEDVAYTENWNLLFDELNPGEGDMHRRDLNEILDCMSDYNPKVSVTRTRPSNNPRAESKRGLFIMGPSYKFGELPEPSSEQVNSAIICLGGTPVSPVYPIQ